VISAADGHVDRIRCGPGHDEVVADVHDQVAGDCEVVTRV
jgi:hypothetical protein